MGGACPPGGGAWQGGDALGRNVGVEVGNHVRLHLGPVLLQFPHNGGSVTDTHTKRNNYTNRRSFYGNMKTPRRMWQLRAH